VKPKTVEVVVVAVGVAVGFVDDVQPLIDTRTSALIKSNGSAYFNGILMYRFIILTIGFIIQHLLKNTYARGGGWLNYSDSHAVMECCYKSEMEL